MSPWLFNVYMDGVVREVNVRVLGKGLELRLCEWWQVSVKISCCLQMIQH